MSVKETKDTELLIVAAKAIGPDFDAAKAAEDLGFTEVPEGSDDLIWLTAAAERAGLGLPADPLRARGWIRFGRPLNEDEKAEPGDIALVTIAGDEVAGIVGDVARSSISLSISADVVAKVGKVSIVTVRRPIGPAVED